MRHSSTWCVGRDGTERDHAGGSAANAAVALARLGRQVRFATRLGGRRARPAARRAPRRQRRAHRPVDPLVLERTATAMATLAEDGCGDLRVRHRVAGPAVSLPARRGAGGGGLRLHRGGTRSGGRRRRRPGRGVAGQRADGLRPQRPPGHHRHRRRGRRAGRADGARWPTSSRRATRTWRCSGRARTHREVATLLHRGRCRRGGRDHGRGRAQLVRRGRRGHRAGTHRRGGRHDRRRGHGDGRDRRTPCGSSTCVGPGAGERLRSLAAAERTSVLAFAARAAAVTVEPTGRRPAAAARARLTAVSRSGEPRPGRGR